MLFLTNLARYLAIFLPLTCVLGLVEGAVRGMWGFTPADLWYQVGAWAVFEAPGLLLVAVSNGAPSRLGGSRFGPGQGHPTSAVSRRGARPGPRVARRARAWSNSEDSYCSPFRSPGLQVVSFMVCCSSCRRLTCASSHSDSAMRTAQSLLLVLALSLPPATGYAQENPNMLSSKEKQDGWRLLFDGSTTDGWRGFKQSSAPDGWKVVEGAITRVGEGGDLITRDEFGNFELVLQWKIAPGGNSGIMYRVTEDGGCHLRNRTRNAGAGRRRPQGWPIPAHGSRFLLRPLPVPGRSAASRSASGTRCASFVNGNHVEHWLNGAKAVEYELGSPDWEARVKASKFAQWPGYGRAPRGHIAIQDHGDRVAYRGIKIRVLP